MEQITHHNDHQDEDFLYHKQRKMSSIILGKSGNTVVRRRQGKANAENARIEASNSFFIINRY